MFTILPSRISSLIRLNRVLSKPEYDGCRFFIVVDENTYNYCLPALISQVERLQEAEFFEVPVGEACKELDIASQLWQTLLESQADRNTVLVNLGGGTISDLGGFVASAFKRGIRYINIPTTLMGMVDASIGGKTAINLAGCKNQIGAFYQPSIICIYPPFLNTLSDEEMFSGTFEMLKTFLIADPEQYSELSAMILDGRLELTPMMIRTCVEIKSAIVKRDPCDCGIRRILNFGHTFGHAIESYSHCKGQKPLPHGMAVGIGMLCALELSATKLNFSLEEIVRYRQVLSKMLMLPHFSLRDTESLLEYMRADKKNAAGEICPILLQDIGAPVVDYPVTENELRDSLLRL